MGTVIPRKRSDGSTGYQAQLLIKRAGKIAHREGRTFDRKQAASAWLEKREKELAKPGALERLAAPDPTLAAVIDRYTDESIKKIGRTKAQVLRAIKHYDITNKNMFGDHERRRDHLCRLEEITRILWEDLDAEGSRILIRDMKNPGEKIGNDVWCDFPPEALQIILSMPKRSEEIFPYSGDTIGTNFTRASQFLEIIDLHLHDLRHDGVSRLFELGRNIPQVAAVSGHRSWSSLKRYTHLRQTGDKYAGWNWFSVLTSSSGGTVASSPIYAAT